MIILILVGVVCFCVFMILALIPKLLEFLNGDRKLLWILAVGFLNLAAVILFEANPMAMLYLTFVGLGLDFLFFKKQVRNGLAIIIYSTAINFGVGGVSSILITVFRLEGLDIIGQRWGLLNLAVFAALTSLALLLKFFGRIEINLLSTRITQLLTIMFGVVLAYFYIYTTIENVYVTFVLFFICIGVLAALILRYAYRESAIKTEMLVAESNKKYIEDLEESYKSLRTIKHDYVNILTSFKLYIDSGDVEGLAKYYYNELSEMNNELLQERRLFESLHNMKISEVKSVLIYKCSYAVGDNIDATIEVCEPIESLGISTAIVCQILGILLDNSIEALLETKEKRLGVAVIKNPKSKTFIIRNSWNRQDIAINELYELGFSTKNKQRGLGLYTVRSYTERIEGLLLDTELGEEFFIQTLTIKDVN